MGFLSKLKGVIRRMLSPETIETALSIQPTISTKMKTAIELWRDMYMDESPWIVGSPEYPNPDGTIKSLGLASMIASEKARTATIEMQIKVTGDNAKAKFVEECYKKLQKDLRTNLEYGIAFGSFIIKPYVIKTADNKYGIEVSYTKATDFYPLSFSSDGKITEAAFLDRIIRKNVVYTKLEYHKLENNTLTIQNRAFKSENSTTALGASNTHGELGTPVALTDISEWAEVPGQVVIENMDSMLFSYFKMPGPNTVDLNSPLGVSGFAKAVDLIRDADYQYSNLLWEFEGGQLAIDVDRTALNPLMGKDGRPIEILPKLQNRLFRHSLDLGEDNTYNVFNPQFRDASLINGLNNILMHIEDVCEMSRGSLSEVTYAEARTATEMRILKQRSFAANKAIQEALERSLRDFANIIDKYCDLYNIVSDGEYDIAYCWDDSIIVDKDTEKQMDLIEVDKGLMSKVEYRIKWMGETEAQAQKALNNIQKETEQAMLSQQKLMQQTTNNTGDGTESAERQRKLETANKSTEVTKNNSSPQNN